MPTLNWIGKEKVVNHHRDVPFRVLQHKYGFTAEKGDADTPTGSGNMIIHGDNLEALKSLLPQYEGKIDCVYIDPPYNTGNEEWIYNDNVNHPKIKKWLGEIVGKEGDDLTRHDKWLCMIFPRLRLLQKLLAKNGTLVISIGHQELFNLILICKEIFGNRQIVPITVQTSGGKPSNGFNYQHEYLIFITPNNYLPNPLLLFGGQSRTPFEGLTLATFSKVQRPNQVYPIFINCSDGSLAGTGKSLAERIKSNEYSGDVKDFSYDHTEAPEGTVAVWPITSKGDECVWRLISTRLKEDWEKGYIKISPNKAKGSKNKYSIQYLPSGVIKKIETSLLEVTGTELNSPTLSFGDNKTVGGQVPTIWLDKSFFTVRGTNLLNSIFGKKTFSYPKPIELVAEALRANTNKDSIILDSFAGSGTTAHAVLKLNKEDGGNRKFILVEMEDYANSITAERVKRVASGYGEGSKAIEGTGGAFDYYELGMPLFTGDNQEFLNEAVGLDKIRKYIWYSETRTPLNEPQAGSDNAYLLGVKEQAAYYFYYQPNELTSLDYDFLATIKTRAEQYVIYADNCLLAKDYLAKNDDNTTFEKLKEQLLSIGIPEEQIKIKTANKDELKGINLMDKSCPVRYIITINALKEGWDCPFAYILASLADKSSAVDVEQILGRVLRQPYVMKHAAPLLNVSYVLTASAKFNETLQNIVEGLQASGFSDKDYRQKDIMPEEEKKAAMADPVSSFLFPEQQDDKPTEEEINKERISFNPDISEEQATEDTVVTEIKSIAEEQNREMEEEIEKQKSQPIDENQFIEMGDKVKRYKLIDRHKDIAEKIQLPQFFIETPQGDIFGSGIELLHQEALLKNFKLSQEDTKVDFERITSDLYKVDIEKVAKDQYTPRFTKIEDIEVKDPVVEYILARPKEKQVAETTNHLVKLIGNMYPIPDQEIRIYIERILQGLNPEQLQDLLVRKYSYAGKIKSKIRQHADNYAEGQFNDLVKIGKVQTRPNWIFPKAIVPGALGGSISNSLYEREASMNNFETNVIADISSLPNVVFWHRNLGRGKGFSINGFKSNHYPDFIIRTQQGNIILLETKGDDRDNPDSASKRRLGNRWADLAGKEYHYFMVYDEISPDGAFKRSKAKELIGKL